MSQAAIKDEDNAHPIADAWRLTIAAIVHRIAGGDYGLCDGVEDVTMTDRYVAFNADYVAHFGETVIDLPLETWTTSIAQWMGDWWDCLIDLYTAESGSSDLVLELRVYEDAERRSGYRFEVGMIYVP